MARPPRVQLWPVGFPFLCRLPRSLALSLERPTVARDTPPSPVSSPFSQVRGLAGCCRVRPTGSCGLWAVLQVSEECA